MSVEFSTLDGRRSRATFTPYGASIRIGRNITTIPADELVSAAEVVWARLAETSNQTWNGHIFCGVGSHNTYIGFEVAAGKGDQSVKRVLVVERATLQIIETKQRYNSAVDLESIGQPA